MKSLSTPLGTAITLLKQQYQFADVSGLNTWKNTFSTADQARPLSEFTGQQRHRNSRYMRLVLEAVRDGVTSLSTPLGTAISATRTSINTAQGAFAGWKNSFSSADQLCPVSDFATQQRHANNRYMRMLLDYMRMDG